MTYEWTCGKCGEEFTSNYDNDLHCPQCEATPCEHCGGWTGGYE